MNLNALIAIMTMNTFSFLVGYLMGARYHHLYYQTNPIESIQHSASTLKKRLAPSPRLGGIEILGNEEIERLEAEKRQTFIQKYLGGK